MGAQADGLLHVSEVAHLEQGQQGQQGQQGRQGRQGGGYVRDAREAVAVGAQLQVYVSRVHLGENKLSLAARPPRPPPTPRAVTAPAAAAAISRAASPALSSSAADVSLKAHEEVPLEFPRLPPRLAGALTPTEAPPQQAEAEEREEGEEQQRAGAAPKPTAAEVPNPNPSPNPNPNPNPSPNPNPNPNPIPNPNRNPNPNPRRVASSRRWPSTRSQRRGRCSCAHSAGCCPASPRPSAPSA